MATKMTAERAIYVLGHCDRSPNGIFLGFFYTDDVPEHEPPHRRARRADGITREEHDWIQMVLGCMGPTDSYYKAVIEIAKGI